MKLSYSFGSASPNPFQAYPRKDFDLESGTTKRSRKSKNSTIYAIKMLKSLGNRVQYYYKLHPVMLFLISFTIGITIIFILSVAQGRYQIIGDYERFDDGLDTYPFPKLKNLVMVAGHSVYISSKCEKVDKEDAWFLESYQKQPGQAATFVEHIQKGVEIAENDDEALLLFSGGETRKDAGPRSEAQSYWLAAESKGWFGKQESVKRRALTEEHARDSFENLLFSICRFRELTGSYPINITVVGYRFKEARFVYLHRSAIRFPESRFFYSGTLAPHSSSDAALKREAALKGEALVRTQFQADPYGCIGALRRKKVGRDPFHRSIPYPNGCPEIGGLFRYCGTVAYPGSLPWA